MKGQFFFFQPQSSESKALILSHCRCRINAKDVAYRVEKNSWFVHDIPYRHTCKKVPMGEAPNMPAKKVSGHSCVFAFSGGFTNSERVFFLRARKFWGCHAHFRSRWQSELNISKQL